MKQEKKEQEPDLPQVACAGAINELLGVRQLEVHVAVGGDQETLATDFSFDNFQ